MAGWNDKLELLVGEAEKDLSEPVFDLVDEGIAEIFDSPEAIRVLLGYQKNTAAGIKTLVRIASGAYAEKDDGKGDPVLVRLSKIMAVRDLENTLVVILSRVAKTLAGVQPLTKGPREEERAAFEELVGDIVTEIGTADGGGVSEAVSSRARMVYGDGFTDLEPGLAIEMVLRQLPNDAARFGYLLDLCGTDFGLRNQSHVIRALGAIVNGLTSVASLVGPDVDEQGVIRAAAEIRDRLLSTKLPDEWRLRFARKIYELLLDYNQGGDGKAAKKQTSKKKAAADEEEAPTRVVKLANLGDESAFVSREVAAGEYLFHEGDAGDEAYLVHNGRIAILRKAGNTDVVIAEVGAGDIVGEMALIDSQPRMAAARAERPTKVTIIPMDEMRKRLDKLEETDPIMRHLVEMFVQRMREYRIVASGH